jgi:hypothetical protein
MEDGRWKGLVMVTSDIWIMVDKFFLEWNKKRDGA